MKGYNRKIKYYSLLVTIILLLVVVDQATKILVAEFLNYAEGVSIIPNFFYLEYIHNEGAAWGMFAGNKLIIIGMPIIGILVFGYLLSMGDFKNKPVYTFSIILMIAGTIGNFIDRVVLGYVIDFLSFRFGSYHYPNFNFADSFLVVGVILFAIELLILEDRRKLSNKDL